MDPEDLFLPWENTEAELSPDENYVAFVRRHSYRNPDRNKRWSETHGTAIDRLLIVNLLTGKVYYTEPAVEAGKNPSDDHDVHQWRWSSRNTLVARTKKSWVEYDASDGSILRKFGIPGSLRGKHTPQLADDPEVPIIAFQTDAGTRFGLSVWSYLPAKKKVRRLTPMILFDQWFFYFDGQANGSTLVVQSGQKGEKITALTVDANGEPIRSDTTLPAGFEHVIVTGTADCFHPNEILVRREIDDETSEYRIFDIAREWLSEAALRTPWWPGQPARVHQPGILQWLREGTGTRAHTELIAPAEESLRKQLASSFPGHVARINSVTRESKRICVELETPATPLAWYLYDHQNTRLMRLFGRRSDLPSDELGETKTIPASWPVNADLKLSMNAVWTLPPEGTATEGTVLYLQPIQTDLKSPGFDYQTHYLALRGFQVLSLQVPTEYFEDAFHATTGEELIELVPRFRTALNATLAKILEEQPPPVSSEDWYLWANYAAVPFAFCLDQSPNGPWRKMVAINPVMISGMPSASSFSVTSLLRSPSLIDLDETVWEDAIRACAESNGIGDLYIGKWYFGFGKESAHFLRDWAQSEHREVESHVPNSWDLFSGARNVYAHAAATNGAAFLLGEELPGR